MDVSDEVRAAAKRIVWWDAGIPPSRIYATTDLIEAANNDAWDLARAHIARLADDDAEQAERDRPIDEEWLDTIIANDAEITLQFGRVTRGKYTWKKPQWCLWLNGEILYVTTRGQLLDLLAALKDGAT